MHVAEAVRQEVSVRNAFLFLLVLLISAACLQAQDDDAAAKANATKLQGCLSYSRDRYTLTEQNGESHVLAGAAGKLGHQVGREIEVTGKVGMRMTDSTLVGGASSATEQEVFEVKTVKRVADECKP